jgi:hypothetical protein
VVILLESSPLDPDDELLGEELGSLPADAVGPLVLLAVAAEEVLSVEVW